MMEGLLLATSKTLKSSFALGVGLILRWVELTEVLSLCTLTVVLRCCTLCWLLTWVLVQLSYLSVLVGDGLLGSSK